MDQTDQWAEQLVIAEERLGEVYDILTELKRDLKNSGRKKDAGAIDEAAQRIGRYGQMFGELRPPVPPPTDAPGGGPAHGGAPPRSFHRTARRRHTSPAPISAAAPSMSNPVFDMPPVSGSVATGDSVTGICASGVSEPSAPLSR